MSQVQYFVYHYDRLYAPGCIAAYSDFDEMIAAFTKQLAQLLADQPQNIGLEPAVLPILDTTFRQVHLYLDLAQVKLVPDPITLKFLTVSDADGNICLKTVEQLLDISVDYIPY